MDRLRNELERRVEAHAPLYRGLGELHYSCPEELVLVEGTEYRGAELPAGYERGRPKRCFANALELALAHPELSYCEGYAMRGDLPLAIYHAWCVDHEGRLVEPTWETPDPSASYIGITFPVVLVARSFFGRSFVGMIENFEQGHPLLRRPLLEVLADYREQAAA